MIKEQFENAVNMLNAEIWTAYSSEHVLEIDAKIDELKTEYIEFLQSRIAELEAIEREFKFFLEIHDEVPRFAAKMRELEANAIVWHKYPEEKPKPNTRHLVVVNGSVHISRYDAEQDIDKINVTHWAYVPDPPKEESNA